MVTFDTMDPMRTKYLQELTDIEFQYARDARNLEQDRDRQVQEMCVNALVTWAGDQALIQRTVDSMKKVNAVSEILSDETEAAAVRTTQTSPELLCDREEVYRGRTFRNC